MRTTTYSLFTLLFAFLSISCLEKEFEIYEKNTEGDFTAFNVDRNNLFIDDVANLAIEAGNFSNIKVDMVSDTINTSVNIARDSISLIQIDDLNYTISSLNAGEHLVQINATDANGSELTGYRRMFFYDHGTSADFTTVETIEINTDSNRKLTALFGEPENLETYEITITRTRVIETDTIVETFIENRERWNYFSKGLSFDVYPNEPSVLTSAAGKEEVVYGATIYATDFSRTIDDVTYEAKTYPYEITGFSKLNTPEGLLIDEVIEKLGEPDNEDPTTFYSYTNAIFFADEVTRKVTSIIVRQIG